MRQTVELFGQYLVGYGSYRQLIIGEKKMFRLEVKLQVGQTTTSMLQVCDGETLWEKRDLGGTQQYGTLTVQHIRELATRQGRGGDEDVRLWFALGGLDLLLRGLAENFEFEEPVPETLGSARLPVWTIRGNWKPATTGEAVSPIPLATHLPHQVVVTLGRDEQLPLFPYRLEYRRRTDDAAESGETVYQRIATVQLFEVQRYAGIDPRHFTQPSDFPRDDKELRVDDLSRRYVRRFDLRVRRQGSSSPR